MAGEFVVTRNGRDTFHDEESLRRLAAAGLLAPGDLVYHPMLGRWLYAREVEEVRAELAGATALGRPVNALPVLAASNGHAVAGFALGLVGMLPIVGILASLLGLYFSGRGLRIAHTLGGRGQGLAIAGLVLSIIFLMPAVACGAILLGTM
ncbi:MAG: hypothetical protein EXR72_22130 [Myxococcales bacterium]|nr:hypothetical protein [Myxococcales bacterium]